MNDAYAAGLRDYLAGTGEAALKPAHELRRRALADGLGVLDLARLHHEALIEVSRCVLTPDEFERTLKAAERFFIETLTAFEATQRGVQEAHAALQVSEERYRALFENANDIAFTTDLDGNFTSINRAGEQLSGYRRDETPSINFAAVIAPEYVEVARRMLQRTLLGEEEHTSYELEIVTKEGSRVPLAVSTRLISLQGRPVELQGIARDITEHKRAEWAMRSHISMNRYLEAFRQRGLDRRYGARLVSYADDFVVLCRHGAAEVREQTRSWLVQMGLTLNEQKIRSSTFLGDTFGPMRYRKDGHWHLGAAPAKTAVQRVKRRIRQILRPSNQVPWSEVVQELNTALRGWAQYFTHGYLHSTRYLAYLNEVREEEGKRIAHALHDEVGQLLASVHLAVAAVASELSSSARERLRQVTGLLDQIEERLRRLSHELRPTILDDLGLLPALEFLAEGVSKRTGLPITVEGSTEGRLPPPVETALYRIVQEALTNVTKHAQATGVSVQLQREAQKICCSVRDDGIGFDVSAALAKRGEKGLGLIGIRERVKALGGRLRIRSGSGQGTELRVTLSLRT